MNKTILLFFLFVIVCNKNVFAQINLVPNPSFEVYSTCPYNLSQIDSAIPWFQPNLFSSSTDFFNSCQTNSISSVPLNSFGYQLARTGIGYAGFSPGINIGCVSEYLEVLLIDTLQIGRKYYVSFYVSRGDNATLSTDGIGICFSDSIVLVNDPNYSCLPYTAQIQNPAGNIIHDSANWILVGDTLLASGGEKFITIGNFNPNAIFTIENSGNINAAYYYIDDISVVDCDSSVGLNELSNHQNNITVFPNPSNTICTITATTFKNATLTLYDLTGRVLLRQKFNERTTLDVGELKEGMYVVELRDNEGRSAKGKLVKN